MFLPISELFEKKRKDPDFMEEYNKLEFEFSAERQRIMAGIEREKVEIKNNQKSKKLLY